jgi:hypothetical protein
MKVSETTHARTGRFGWRDRNNIGRRLHSGSATGGLIRLASGVH